ncbi:hypothetical protein BKD80_03255 [Corynebacterium diphtheriae]|uniref:hypothetical protein n=2 Tax=Corynebacterium diphtheriae TaxID=1717 RepID=UPI00086A0C06|nr:hypothetical protein BHU47_03780 [Corynebacterium diphtheriae]OJH92426.1 hypothetical protein BKD80_03255 [Corynebacterium diphtheriae]OLN18046.1 hypothetical protein BUE68_04925 [Corynebacterium diphtheriae]OLO15206.1 hypothetical protein BUV99_02155 [Corynebacterium diphtheriae]OMO44392.1 hypothetical protein BVL41_04200 [Corynebacterium diphtheriae]
MVGIMTGIPSIMAVLLRTLWYCGIWTAVFLADAVLDKTWGAGLTLVLLISLLTIGARVISAKTKVAV